MTNGGRIQVMLPGFLSKALRSNDSVVDVRRVNFAPSALVPPTATAHGTSLQVLDDCPTAESNDDLLQRPKSSEELECEPAIVRTQAARFSDAFYERAVWVAVGCYISLYLFLGFRNHAGFGTFAMDLGIYDQAAWLISRGKSYITVRGIDTWGHHNNAVFFLFAPFYWLGAGPRFLIFVETTMLGLGAIPVFRIASAKLRSGSIGLFFALCYLVYPPTGWLSQWTFHPESLSVTAVLFAWWFAKTRRVAWLGIVVLFALSTREEVGLVIAMMGVVLLFAKSTLDPWPSRANLVRHPREKFLRWGIPVALVTVGLAWILPQPSSSYRTTTREEIRTTSSGSSVNLGRALWK